MTLSSLASFLLTVSLLPMVLIDGRMLQETTNDVAAQAAALMNFARIAYSFPKIRSMVREPQLCERYSLVTTSKPNPKQTVFVLYRSTVNPRSLILSFRGTDVSSLQNIITDLEAVPARCILGDGKPCGNVHSGFQEAYLEVQEEVKRAVKGASSIAVTGHSLGKSDCTLPRRK